VHEEESHATDPARIDPPPRPWSTVRGRILWPCALLGAAALASFLRLGTEPVYILNEAREGVYARAMISSGNWILPEVPNHVENGHTIQDKPPLFHWIAAGSTWVRALLDGRAAEDRDEVARGLDAWSLRFPSALAACATVLGILLLAPRLIGRRAAWIAAGALLASWQFVNQARYGRVDMCLCCCTTWAMLLSGVALVERSGRALLGAAIASGLAVLSKGPVGLVLPVLACASWSVAFDRRGSAGDPARRRLPWIQAALLWALVALPWYLAAWRIGGSAFLDSQIRQETLGQFTGLNGRMRFFYYLGPWATDGFPWNLVALFAAYRALREKNRGARFLLAWWAAFLAFFQVAAYKRGAYLLPALPAAALLAGWQLDRWIALEDLRSPTAREPRLGIWAPAALCAGLAVGIAGALLDGSSAFSRWTGRAWSPDGFPLAVGGLAAFAVALAAAVRGTLRHDPRTAIAAGVAALLALFAGAFTGALASLAASSDPGPMIARIESAVPAGEPITVRGVGDDPSLLLLFHAARPDRFAVVPEGSPALARSEAGTFLFSSDAWSAFSTTKACGKRWTVLLRDELRERGRTVTLVLARRRAAGPRRDLE
jgi:4-amino-4-deoxy-L-arabinose transferase-like glycosyltransferase